MLYITVTSSLQRPVFFIQKQLKKKTLSFAEIEGKIDELFDSTKIDLETFEIFDIFELSEHLKSGSSKTAFSSFYQDLLLSLTLEASESNDNSIQIFELFEFFLYSRSQKLIFLRKLVFENGSIRKIYR